MENLNIQLIALLGGLIASMFGLVKYLTYKHDALAKTFLSYIQTKNGITERMGKDFSEAIERINKEHTEAMQEMLREVKRK